MRADVVRYIKPSSRQKGKLAEEKACEYLKSLGYKFIQKNFFIKGGEIDLIFKDSDFIVFVEVKSLKANSAFNIFETISNRKKRFLNKVIYKWLEVNDQLASTWRVDFVGIIYEGTEVTKIEHLKFLDLE